MNAFDYLTAGDSHDYIEAELGSAVTSFTNNGIDVVKVNHHGSRYSSDAGFLAEVSPEVAVCSVGYYSSFGHPTQDAYGRLNDAGAYIYQTCLDSDSLAPQSVPGVNVGQGEDVPCSPISPRLHPKQSQYKTGYCEDLGLTRH